MIARTIWADCKDTFLCYAKITKEPEGGYSIYSLNLPGCASQGDTPKDALKNISEAFRGLLESYRSDGVDFPFNDYRGKVGDKVIKVTID